MKLDSPIFIIGNPRSGTTLLRLTLNSHPLICIPPESHFFLWLEKNFHSWTQKDGLKEYLHALFDCTKFETWNIDYEKLKEFLFENNPQNYSQLNALVYMFYGNSNHSKNIYWGDKNKLWKEKLHLILRYYPKGRIIHIHRDGRDVACSYRELNMKSIKSKYAPKLPNDIEHIALKWKENIANINEFEKSIPKNQLIRISYEELVNDQQSVAKRICEFLQLKLPENKMCHLSDDEKFNDEPKDFLQWKSKIMKPIDKKNIGKFKEILSNREIEIFNQICKSELKYLNYE